MDMSFKLYVLAMLLGCVAGLLAFPVWIGEWSSPLMGAALLLAVVSALVGMVASVFALFGKEEFNG